MKKKNETDALNERIVLLQNKQALELKLLKEQFHLTYESLKPINLFKSTVDEVVSSPDIKDNMLNNVIGLAVGYLSRKVLLRASHNPIKNILGTVLQFAVANVVSKHSDTIKSTGENILQRILKYRNAVKQ
jgi:hypothetical protein